MSQSDHGQEFGGEMPTGSPSAEGYEEDGDQPRVRAFVSYSRLLSYSFEASSIQSLQSVLEREVPEVELRRDVDCPWVGPFYHEVHREIDNAKIALLLLNEEFFANGFIQDVELPAMIKRAVHGHLTIIPILVEATSLWAKHPVSRWQIHPQKKTGLASGEKAQPASLEEMKPTARLEEALAEIVKAVKAAAYIRQGIGTWNLDPRPFMADIEENNNAEDNPDLWEKVADWLQKPESKPVFWIRGEPGTGKTTLALRACRLGGAPPLEEPNAFYFFRPRLMGGDRDKEPAICIKYLIKQLYTCFPQALELDDIEPARRLNTTGQLDELFDLLVHNRLWELTDDRTRPDEDIHPLVVIDALDDCPRRQQMARCLAKYWPEGKGTPRLLVTSQPVDDLVEHLKPVAQIHELSPADKSYQEVVKSYARNLLGQLLEGEEAATVARLATRLSKGCGYYFVFVSTVISQLKDQSEKLPAAKRRQTVRKTVDCLPASLGAYYLECFDAKYELIENDLRPVLELLVGSLSAAPDWGLTPLDLDSLSSFLEGDQPQALEQLQPWFDTTDPIPGPYHQLLYYWLIGKQTTTLGSTGRASGERAQHKWRVDEHTAHRSLAEACWRQYGKAESLYTLANLPLLMACAAVDAKGNPSLQAEYWGKFEGIVNDFEFANRGHSGSYRQWYRFEHEGWQLAFAEWVDYLQGLRDGQRRAQLAILEQYFGGFWWWGEYIEDWDACHTFKGLLDSSGLGKEAHALSAALQEFEDTWHGKKSQGEEERWEGIAAALQVIRTACGIPEPGASGLPDDTTEDLPVAKGRAVRKAVLTITLITDIYLGQSYAKSDPGRARRHFARALRLSHAKHLKGVEWFEAWIYHRRAQMHWDQGQPWKAAAGCRRGLRVVVHPDHEVKANLFHTGADALWKLSVQAQGPEQKQRREQALRAEQWALLYAYRFQAMPHPADEYTGKFYQEACGWAVKRLRLLPRADCPEWMERFHAQFQPYWKITHESPRLPESGTEADGEEGGQQDWCSYLAPAQPNPLEDDQRKTERYALRAKEVLTRHALDLAGAYELAGDWEKAVQFGTIAFFRCFRLLFEPYYLRGEQPGKVCEQVRLKVVDLVLEAHESDPEATCLQLRDCIRDCWHRGTKWPQVAGMNKAEYLRCLRKRAKGPLGKHLLPTCPPRQDSEDFTKTATLLAEAGENLGKIETELEIACIVVGLPDPLDLRFPNLDA
jgi:hypothetical protein